MYLYRVSQTCETALTFISFYYPIWDNLELLICVKEFTFWWVPKLGTIFGSECLRGLTQNVLYKALSSLKRHNILKVFEKDDEWW